MSLSKMTVVQLRAALEADGLDTSGLKPALLKRYQDALDAKAESTAQTKRSNVATSSVAVQVAEASPKRQRTRRTLETSPVQSEKKVTKASEPEKAVSESKVEKVTPEPKLAEGPATRKRKATQAEEKVDIPKRTTRKKLPEPIPEPTPEPTPEPEPSVEIEQAEKKVEPPKRGRKKFPGPTNLPVSEPPVEQAETKAEPLKPGRKKLPVSLPVSEPAVEEVEPVGRSTRNKTAVVAERRPTRSTATAKLTTPPKLLSKSVRGKKAKEPVTSPPRITTPGSNKRLRVDTKTTPTQLLSEEADESGESISPAQPDVSPAVEPPTKIPTPAKATPAKVTPAKATPAQSLQELKTPPLRTISTRRTPTPSSLTALENGVKTPRTIATRRTPAPITPLMQATTPGSTRKRASLAPKTPGSALSSSLSALSSPAISTPILTKSAKKFATPVSEPVSEPAPASVAPVTPSSQTSAVKSAKKKVFASTPSEIVAEVAIGPTPSQVAAPSPAAKSTRKTARTPALVFTPVSATSTPLLESKDLTPAPTSIIASSDSVETATTLPLSKRKTLKATTPRVVPQTPSAQDSVLQTPKVADGDATPSPAVEVFQILKINKRREKAPIVDTPFRTSAEVVSRTRTPKLAEAQLTPASTPKSSVSDAKKLLISPTVEEKNVENVEDFTQIPVGKNQGKTPVKNSIQATTPADSPESPKSFATPSHVARRRSLSMEIYAKQLLGEAESTQPSRVPPKSTRKTAKKHQQTKQVPVEIPNSISEKSTVTEKTPLAKPVATIPLSPWEVSLQRLTLLTKAESTWVVSTPHDPLSAAGEVFMREAIKTGFCWPRNSLPSGEHSWLLYHSAMCLRQDPGNFLGTKHTVPIGAHTYDIRPFERQMYYQQVLFGKAQDSSLLNFCCVLIRPMSIMLVVTSKQSHLLANGLLEYVEQSLRQKL